MKFTAIFLTGAALAQHALVFQIGGRPMPVNPAPGECTPLYGIPIEHAITSPDVGLKFYNEPECNGKQIATSIDENLNPRGLLQGALSVKVVPRHELTKEQAGYLSSPNKYNKNNLKSGIPKSQPDYYIHWGRY